jgi:hypothetical protein
MRAIVVAGVVAAAGMGGPAGPAVGQEPSTTRPVGAVPSVGEVAAAIVDDGWYAHPEAVGDREQLDQIADRLSDGRFEIGFALLADEPPGSSTRFAEEVLDEVNLRGVVGYPGRTTTPAATAGPGAGASTSVSLYDPPLRIRTVVVLSDADVGVVSDLWGDDAIDAALDATIDQLRADPTDGLDALAEALADQPTGTGTDDDPDEGDDYSGAIVVGVVLLGLLVFAQVIAASNSLAGDGGGSSRRRRFNTFTSRPFSSGSRGGGSRRSGSGGSRGSSRGRGGRRL